MPQGDTAPELRARDDAERSQMLRRRHGELQRLVGHTTSTDLGVAHSRDFMRFATASGEDPVQWRRAAPPLFVTSVMGWGPGPAARELRADGTTGAEIADLPLQGLRVMGGGQDLELLAPVVDGDRLSVEVTVEEIELREGRTGPMLVVRLLSVFRDAAGRDLVRCHESFLAR